MLFLENKSFSRDDYYLKFSNKAAIGSYIAQPSMSIFDT